jgi:hypothetical protein
MNMNGINNKAEKPENIFPQGLKENPFRVPEGYFQDFSRKVDARIAAEARTKAANVVQLRPRIWLAAASLALLVTIGSVIILRQQPRPEPGDVNAQVVSVQDIDDSGLIDRIDEFTIMDLFPEDNIYLLEEDINSTFDDISDDDIKQYLLQSNEIEGIIQNM